MDLGLSRLRTTALLLGSGALLLLAIWWARTASVDPHEPFTTAVQVGASWLLVACCSWLVAMAFTLLIEAVRRQPARNLPWDAPPPVMRRLVAISSGAAMSLGLASPALAAAPLAVPPAATLSASTTAVSMFDGVRLPSRPVGGTGGRHGKGPSHLVVPGDTLWQIVRQRVPSADAAEVSRLVALLHHRNRALVGPDPDVLVPGQRLRFPAGLR